MVVIKFEITFGIGIGYGLQLVCWQRLIDLLCGMVFAEMVEVRIVVYVSRLSSRMEFELIKSSQKYS
jgi:hypothetical protein